MTELLLFGLLVLEGLSAGFSYRLLDKLRKTLFVKLHTKKVATLVTEGATDVFFVLTSGFCFFLTCFFLSNRMRLSYLIVFALSTVIALAVRKKF